MAKTSNKEQEEYNKQRIVDINLVLQYMQQLDINKEYFTDIGEGHLRGLASLKDELTFISKQKYDKDMLKAREESSGLQVMYSNLKYDNEQLNEAFLQRDKENAKLQKEYDTLNEFHIKTVKGFYAKSKKKKSWLKW